MSASARAMSSKPRRPPLRGGESAAEQRTTLLFAVGPIPRRAVDFEVAADDGGVVDGWKDGLAAVVHDVDDHALAVVERHFVPGVWKAGRPLAGEVATHQRGT